MRILPILFVLSTATVASEEVIDMTPFTAKLTVANIQGRECLALINSGVKKSNGDACSRYADSAIEYLKVSKQFEAVINTDAFLNAQILNEPRESDISEFYLNAQIITQYLNQGK